MNTNTIKYNTNTKIIKIKKRAFTPKNPKIKNGFTTPPRSLLKLRYSPIN